MINKKPKIGLVLGSGGAKGLAHIGVIKVLEKNNIPIDIIAGTSIGAIVGAHYAKYKDIEGLEKIISSSNWRTALSIFDPTLKGGLVKGEKIEKLLNTWFKEYTFDDLQIPLTVIATDLLSGKEIDIDKGSLTKAVRASMAVPPILRPIKTDDYLLTDGGLSNPLPDDIAKRMGADIIIVVNLDSQFSGTYFEKETLSIKRIISRSLNIIRYHLAKSCLSYADIIITPEVGEINIGRWEKFFNKTGAKEMIEVGEKATEKIVADIKRLIKEKSL